MPGPRVEFLWWSGCPSWERALAELREAMVELGLDPGSIERHRIESDADAERESFVGSPTIRVDGVDIQGPERGTPPGLTCRVYRRRDGRISPLPDPEDLREELAGADRPR
jgi:hypothetical protein